MGWKYFPLGNSRKPTAMVLFSLLLFALLNGSAMASPLASNYQGDFQDVVIFGGARVALKANSQVLASGPAGNVAGDIVVNDQLKGNRVELVVGVGATTSQESNLVAETIGVRNRASVPGGPASLFCDSLRGTGSAGLACGHAFPGAPVLEESSDPTVDLGEYPLFLDGNPGPSNVIVNPGSSSTISSSDNYGAIVVRDGASLTISFSDSRVDVRSIRLGDGSSLLIDAAEDAEIRVKGKIITGNGSKLGPATGAIDASNIVFYVEDAIRPRAPLAVGIGSNSDIDGTIYVDLDGGEADGRLTLGDGTDARGGFFAPEVVVGVGTTVTFDSFFGNAAPDAVDDSIGVFEDDAASDVTATLLANDTDPDGDPLSITGIDDTGTLGIVTLVAGEVSYDPNGQFESLAAEETTSDTFSYTISDGNGGTDTATVTVIITGQIGPPTITSTPVTTATEDLLYTYDVDATDPDVGDTLTFSLDTAPTGMAIDALTGLIQWTPDNSQVGSNSVTVRVADLGSLFDTQSFTITVANVNDAPVVNLDPNNSGGDSPNFDAGDFLVASGTSVNLSDGDATITDADTGATITALTATITVGLTDTSDEVLSASASGGIVAGDITYNPAAGVLSIAPGTPQPPSDFQDVLRTIAYDNNAASPTDGARTISIVANDGTADSATVTSTITVVSNQPPVANNDSYNSIGNVGLNVPAPGVLGNDTDPDLPGDTLTVIQVNGASGGVGSSITLPSGADLQLNSDGSFTYNPPAGTTGSDSFTYTIEDSAGEPATATALIAITDMVWFIDNSAGAGDGRLNTPFNTLAAFEAVNGGSGAGDPAAGDCIFLHTGASDYDGGVTLEDDQILLGQGVSVSIDSPSGCNITLPPDSNTLPTTGGSRPVIVDASGDGILLAQNNTIRGLNVGNTPSNYGVSGSSFGTLSLSEMSITGTGGALSLDTGTLSTVALDEVSSSSSPGRGILLSSTSGSFTVSGNVSITNPTNEGIRISNSSGMYTFSGSTKTIDTGSQTGVSLSGGSGSLDFTGGGLDIDTTSGTGFSATGGGTVNVSGSGNSISSGTGIALNINGTNIGASGLTFQSISAGTDSNSAGTGIILDNTGSAGGLTVTGVASTAASGGTIRNKTGSDGGTSGIGIFLNQTSNVSLSNVQLNDFSNFAIRGTDVNNFTLTDSTISGSNGTSAAHDEGSVSFDNLTGTVLFQGSNISGGMEDNIVVTNTTGGTSLNMTVRDSASKDMIIGLNSNSLGNDGILLETQSSASAALNIDGVEFIGARGDLVQANSLGNSSQNVSIQNSTFFNSHLNIVSGSGGITISGGSASSNVNVIYDISNNQFTGAVGNAITANWVSGSGTVTGTITGNTIGIPGSGSTDVGSSAGSGISVGSNGSVVHNVTISGNTIRDVIGFTGIDLLANNASTLNARLNNNTVAEMSGAGVFSALYAIVGGSGEIPGDTATMNLDISNNSLDAGGTPSGGNAAFFDQISTAAHYNFPSYGASTQGEFATPSGTASADLDSYLTGRGNSFVNGAFPSFPGGVDAGVAHGITNGAFPF